MTLFAFHGAIEQGIIYSLVALGLFLSYRVLNVADLTVDGSFTLGGACSVMLALYGHPWLGILVAVLAGAAAGLTTALLQTKLKVQPILAGILTMTALYSINLRVMGDRPNVNLIGMETIFTPIKALLRFDSPTGRGFEGLLLSLVLVAAAVGLLVWFLHTQVGFAIRATGDNEDMVRSSSINADACKIIALCVANAIVALSGALLAQQQSVADSGMGTGMVVVGLASLILGEVLFGRKSVLRGALAAVLGSIVYRVIIALALSIDIRPSDLKLISAIIVAAAISYPTLKGWILRRKEAS